MIKKFQRPKIGGKRTKWAEKPEEVMASAGREGDVVQYTITYIV